MYVTVNNCRLFYDVYGSQLNVLPDRVKEKPTLIILHGGLGIADHTLYVKFWSQLADLVQVIFLDLRGCGRSEASDSSKWNLEWWAKDLYEFCEILGIEKPIVAGVAMGGHVLSEYATHYPDHPGALIFCNTEAYVNLEDVCSELEALGGKEPADIAREFYTSPTQAKLEDFFNICVPYYAKHAYSKIEFDRCIRNPDVFIHYVKNEMFKFNYLDKLDRITCPVLFLVGGTSPIHPAQRSREMAQQLRIPTLVSLRIFGHVPVFKESDDQEAHAQQDALKALRDFILDCG